MTNEQYLDAISCPRIDPIKQGTRILGDDDASSTAETSGNEGDQSSLDLGETTEEEDTAADIAAEETIAQDEGEEEWEYWPPGAVRPDDMPTQVRMEAVSRKLVAAGNDNATIARNENIVMQTYANDPTRRAQCSWLWKEDPHHIYYKWRLSQNRIGKGIPEEKDRIFLK